jgi:hypothetical protein
VGFRNGGLSCSNSRDFIQNSPPLAKKKRKINFAALEGALLASEPKFIGWLEWVRAGALLTRTAII